MRGEKKVRICRLRHLNGYISGTGSRRHETSELDQELSKSFQTSLSAYKSVQPSPRNMRGEKKVRICRLRHLNGYISGTGSRRHETFKLDQ